MGSSGIPNPFQAPTPQGAPVQGGVVGPNASLAMKQQPGAQIAQAMQQMLTGYVSGKQAREQHYDQKYQQAVQDIVNGTNPNPDYHEIMKWAKLSGRPINMKVNPAEAQAQGAVQQSADQTKSAMMQDQSQAYQGGQPIQAPAGSPAAGQGMPPQGQAPAQQGMMSKLLHGTNIPDGTAMEGMLRGMQGVGQSAGGGVGAAGRAKESSLLDQQMHNAAAKMGFSHDESMIPVYTQVLKKALGGDPQSMQMLDSLGIGKSNPLNDYKAMVQLANPQASPEEVNQQAGEMGLQMQMGLPQFRMKMYELAAAPDRLAMFGNDFGKSFANLQDPVNGPAAGMTPLQQSQLAEADSKQATKTEAYASAHGKYYNELMDQYPDAPPSLLNIYANAKAAGQDETASAVSKFIGGDVSSKQPARYKTKNQWESTRFDQRMNFDYTSYNGNLGVRTKELDNQKLNTVLGALRENPTAKAALSIVEHQGDHSGDEVRGAYQTLQQQSQNLKDLKVDYNGKELPITNPQDLMMNYTYSFGGTPGGGWAYGHPSLSPAPPPKSDLQKFYAPPPPSPTGAIGPTGAVGSSSDSTHQLIKNLAPGEQEALQVPNFLRVQ